MRHDKQKCQDQNASVILLLITYNGIILNAGCTAYRCNSLADFDTCQSPRRCASCPVRHPAKHFAAIFEVNWKK